MLGREPMNSRKRQFALAGTVTGWQRLSRPNPRQLAVLRSVYAGRHPLTYGRYGRRQWKAPWAEHLVVKDPFALLSIPTIVRATGAVAVVVYRHPAAALISYRRQGWTASLDNLHSLDPPDNLENLVDRVGWIWKTLYRTALSDLPQSSIVISHSEVAANPDLLAFLLTFLGLPPSVDSVRRPLGSGELHSNLDEDPGQIAESWRHEVDQATIKRIEADCIDVLTELHRRRFTGTEAT